MGMEEVNTHLQAAKAEFIVGEAAAQGGERKAAELTGELSLLLIKIREGQDMAGALSAPLDYMNTALAGMRNAHENGQAELLVGSEGSDNRYLQDARTQAATIVNVFTEGSDGFAAVGQERLQTNVPKIVDALAALVSLLEQTVADADNANSCFRIAAGTDGEIIDDIKDYQKQQGLPE